MRHLTSDQLIDLAEGVLPESSAAHLQSCGACRRQLAQLRASMSAVAEVPVPDPSPLFWDHFSARVHEAVEAESAGNGGGTLLGPASWWRVARLWVGAFAVLVLAVVFVTRGGRPELPVSTPINPVAATGEPAPVMPPIDEALGQPDDPSLALVADLAVDLDWDAATEAGFTTHVGIDNDAVTQLSDGERRALQQLLKSELARPGA